MKPVDQRLDEALCEIDMRGQSLLRSKVHSISQGDQMSWFSCPETGAEEKFWSLKGAEGLF